MSSTFRQGEVLNALCAGLKDTDLNVRIYALSAVAARAKADAPLITTLRDIRASDPDQHIRDRADSTLRKLGAS